MNRASLLASFLLIPLCLQAQSSQTFRNSNKSSESSTPPAEDFSVGSNRGETDSVSNLTLTDDKPLVIRNGKEDNQCRDIILINSKAQPISVSLPENVIIPPTCASISNPLSVPGNHKAQLRLQWSKPLGVWWVQAFFSVKQYASPANNILSTGEGWSRLVQWHDPTKMATISFRNDAASMSLPSSGEFNPNWPKPTAPFISTTPQFASSLKGNWTLETRIRLASARSTTAKTCGAVGVLFGDEISIFAMRENGIGGSVVSLNNTKDNNLSIPFNSPVCYLRLIKSGPKYSFAYSSDGQDWTTGSATFTEAANPTSAFAGVGTWDGASETSYTFDYLTLTPEKSND